jgi:DNA-binding response OmpR family regulator
VILVFFAALRPRPALFNQKCYNTVYKIIYSGIYYSERLTVREIAMNNPLSDGNESVVDIFVLGQSEPETLELLEQLEHQNYRGTLFADGPQLIDTLRSGKPNLIICDTTSFGQDAYEYCRQIKSDENLWMIPVMILTRASSLGDLLYVLDSNADNFIAKPYDSPYLLSLIEGMLLTPVERQTPDQIKTQFKIQHDGRIFVVTADRRKLLEFLLSAFEIAVTNSEDLSSAHTELQALSSRLKTLEDTGIENTRVIGMLSASVKKKEEDERALRGDLEETTQALDEKIAEVGHLLRDLGDARTLLTAAEEHIRVLFEEKGKTAVSHQSETSLLAEQVASHSQEISAKRTELDTVQQMLEEEKKRSAELALLVRESAIQKEQLESSLQALTLDHERLTLALASEKKRAESAEQETKSVLQAKIQSEEDLTHRIDEQEDTARRQNDEITRLKADLEAEAGRSASANERVETLLHEREQSEATHELKEESQKRQIDDLQTRLDTAVATIFHQERELKILKDDLVVAHANVEKSAVSLASVTAAFKETQAEVEEREWKVQSLEKQVIDTGIQKETSDEKVRALLASLESVQQALNTEKEQHAALTERLNTEIRERDETLQSVRDAHNQTRTEIDLHKHDLSQLNSELTAAALLRSTLQGDITAASSRIKELEHELKSAVLGQDQTGQQVRVLAEERDGIRSTLEEALSALAGEKEQHAALKAQLDAAVRERDETLQLLRGAHNQTKTDLEAAARLNSTLLADFKAASSRINELEHELNSVVKGKDQTGQQARSLSDELEGTKAELETERRIRRTAEMDLQKSVQVNNRLEGEITRSTAEREQLQSALEQERVLHAAALEKIRTASPAKEPVATESKPVKVEPERHDDPRGEVLQGPTGDFGQVLARQRDLEQMVKTLEYQKAAAEARADALSDEIQQARTALADEWEDHMNDEERLAASEVKAIQLEQSLSRTGAMASERERKWAVVVKQTGLPAEIGSAAQELVISTPPATHAVQVLPDQNQKVSPLLRIEDLFEDDLTGPAVADRTSEAPEPSSADSSVETPDSSTKEDPAEDLGTADEPDAAVEADEDAVDDAGEPVQPLDHFMATPSGYGISFNRQQWFDLLKWSHHSGALSQAQRMQIVRMGRLIQRGRKLTKKQDEQVREMIVLVQTLGYKFH